MKGPEPLRHVVGFASLLDLLYDVGMGDLASDAQWVPTPDTLWQGKDGALILFAADWDGDVEIGTGWANYRIF